MNWLQVYNFIFAKTFMFAITLFESGVGDQAKRQYKYRRKKILSTSANTNNK